MAESWWRRLGAAVERVYERRIRAASMVGEYGQHHADHDEDEEEAAEILNVPRGTAIRRIPVPPSPSSGE